MSLISDRSKPELFVMRLKLPNGYFVAPHFHTATVTLTVLQGVLVLGMGERVDSTKVQRLGPGSFHFLPAGMKHFEWFEGETIVQVQGIGPFMTIYLNPADDPRNRK